MRADNVEEANQAVLKFKELLEQRRSAIQHELDMDIVAENCQSVKGWHGSSKLRYNGKR